MARQAEGTADAPGAPVVLASGSPRRRELLGRIVAESEVVPAEVDETPLPGETPPDLVARLAAAKAEAVSALRPAAVVIGSDTTVELDGEALGKPLDAPDARATLSRLSGRTHRVHTAVAVAAPSTGLRVRVVSASVTFGALGEDEIDGYVEGGEPMDKAGSYAIQGSGAALVERLEGDPTTVVGLPLRPTLEMLAEAGVEVWVQQAADPEAPRPTAPGPGAPAT